MRVAELLRKLADVIATAEGDGDATSQVQTNAPELMQVDVANDDTSDPGVFVPPLQAKIELLKKSVNVDNIYDDDEDLGRMKKLSGINAVAVDEAGSDEPLDI